MILVAHRTPASARRCAGLAAAGVTVFEVDVQLRGGRVAVSHYQALGPARGLQRDNWRLRWHTRSRLDPELAEVDAAVPAGSRVLLDVKEVAPTRRRALVGALADALAERDRYVVCSPFPDDLDQARAAGFTTWRTVRSRAALAPIWAAQALRDEAVTVRHSLLDAAAISALGERVGTVVAWTVNDPQRARDLRRLGVAGVTTDRMEVLRTLSSA
jgi:glycerophosphoryl diester phosphodiesterase